MSKLAEHLLKAEFISSWELIDKIPHAIGRYKIASLLGEGASGRVYLAHDERIGRPVAIKVLQPGVARDPAKFEKQIRLEATVQHEHIAAIYDAGCFAGQPYFVMQYGGSQSLADRRLQLRQAVAVLCAAARACAAAHALGIIHRDLKPANILLSDPPQGVEAEDPWALVADFGLARLLDAETRECGSIAGTPAYMAPEQALQGRVSPQSDIYALGVMLYEQITGVHPFRTEAVADPTDIPPEQNPEPPESPAAIAAGLPAELERITLKAMAPKPQHRYAAASELAEDLDRWLSDPQGPRSATTSAAAPGPVAAKRIALLLLVPLIAALAYPPLGNPRKTPATENIAAPRRPLASPAEEIARRTLLQAALKLETWKRELYQPAAPLATTMLGEVVAVVAPLTTDPQLPDPLRQQAYLTLAQARALAGDTTTALRDLTTALTLAGPPQQKANCHYQRALLSWDAHLAAAVLDPQAGRRRFRNSSLDDLRQSLRLKLPDPWHKQFATTLVALGDGARLQQTLADLEKLAEMREQPAEQAMRAAADLLLLTGDPEQASAKYHEALRHRSSYVQAYTGLALASHAQKNLRKSLHYTIAAIEINPQYQPAYTLFNQLTRRALNKTPDSLLAKAPLEDGAILDRWLSILEASCHSAPDNSQLLAARGSVRMLRACQEAQIRALSNLSEIDLAIADFEKAVAADPENITARVLAGIAHLLAGQGRHPQAEHLSAACDQLREAVALDPQSGDTYRWLGYATAAAGRPQAAIASWQQALQLDSAHGSDLVARIAKAGGNQPPQRATRNPLPQAGS